MSKTLRVLIVDDSPTARALLRHLIEAAPDMRVIGEAADGEQAVHLAYKLRPDVILMDVIMPKMDGLEATREIMGTAPTPIVLVSASLNTHETDIAFRAMSMGALALHRKPHGVFHADHEAEASQLITKLRLMADVRVIHHWKPRPESDTAAKNGKLSALAMSVPAEVVAVVSSTGGPAALSTLVQQLPQDFKVPVVIVQHISPDFTESLKNWLSQMSALVVKLAEPGEYPMPGTIYLAPGKAHLRLSAGRRFELDPEPGEALHMPSGNIFLESVARSYRERAIGVILTGMGDDGANGLLAMHRAGAFTIAQDEASSVVYGMPKAAKTLGAVRQVLPLPGIADALVRLVSAQETL
jgi:two-component system chemotaxis response regulator CheB